MHQSFGAYIFRQTYNLIDRFFTVFFITHHTPSLFFFYITQSTSSISFLLSFQIPSATPTLTHFCLCLAQPNESIPVVEPVFQLLVPVVCSFQLLVVFRFQGGGIFFGLTIDFAILTGSSWSLCLERTQRPPNTSVNPTELGPSGPEL